MKEAGLTSDDRIEDDADEDAGEDASSPAEFLAIKEPLPPPLLLLLWNPVG